MENITVNLLVEPVDSCLADFEDQGCVIVRNPSFGVKLRVRLPLGSGLEHAEGGNMTVIRLPNGECKCFDSRNVQEVK